MSSQPIRLQLYEIELGQRKLEPVSEDRQLEKLKAKLETKISRAAAGKTEASRLNKGVLDNKARGCSRARMLLSQANKLY